jgi:hypothetical protein
MVAIMEERFADLNIKFSVGGQISFDAFPVGWDKTFCLRYVVPDNYDEIHFFGDKTYKVRKLEFRVFMADSNFSRLGIYLNHFRIFVLAIASRAATITRSTRTRARSATLSSAPRTLCGR